MRFLARPLLALFFVLTACSPSVPQGTLAADQSKVTDVGSEMLEPQIDIIFVIDNSGSMYDHQANLSANIGSFIQAFFQNIQVDFHIGVLTTDDDGGSTNCCGLFVTNPSGPAVLDRNVPDFRNILTQRMMVGTNGSPTEKVFDPIYKALTLPNLNGANMGFLRNSATLAIVFITDAEDQSAVVHDAQTLEDFLAGLKGSASQVLSYGVIVPSGVSNCPRDSDDEPKRLEQFLSFSPSAPNNEFSLCDPQFGSRIAQIGQDLAARVSSTLRLKRVPVLSSIRLNFGTQIIPADPLKGWSFDAANNAIHIGPDVVWSTQPPGTRLTIHYTPTKFDDPTP